jgi:glycosyltransferase involved in cell wall biosynthesis
VIRRAPLVRLLIMVNEDWYFWIHWRDLMGRLRQEGFEVVVATHVMGEDGRRIADAGFQLEPIALRRTSRHPLREIRSCLELVRLYRRIRPDVAVHVSLKPILYGSLAAALAGVPSIVNVFAGLGYIFTDPSRWYLRLPVGAVLRVVLAMSRSRAVFHNREDRDQMVKAHFVRRDRTIVIPGVGVDLAYFAPRPEPIDGPYLVLLPSRMLWDKGVGEFVEAAARLRAGRIPTRWVLAGRIDAGNPSAIPEEQLREWESDGIVEWWGHQDDMPSTLSAAHVVVLPSYREGLPTALLEACACARPVVASDVPGCREVVRPGVNGFLVPPRDPGAIANAVQSLVEDQKLRLQMGLRGREIVEREFSVDRISYEMSGLFRRLLNE